MLTLIACPKSFLDPHIAMIQTNAITSWTLLRPRPEILVFGAESGIAELCSCLNVRHVSVVVRNEFGTPLLNDVMDKARALTAQPLLCYLNADIVLTSAFSRAVIAACQYTHQFLLSGGRWNFDLAEQIDFRRDDWEQQIEARVKETGKFSFWGNDYFVFPRDLYRQVPPLAIGRAWFDAWFFSEARSLGASVIDASASVMAIHQNHHYRHTSTKDGSAVWSGVEADRNAQWAGTRRHWFLLEATFVLTSDGLQRTRARKTRFRLREVLIYRTGGLRRALKLQRSSFERKRIGRLCGLRAVTGRSRREP